jgi:hypothetical protein
MNYSFINKYTNNDFTFKGNLIFDYHNDENKDIKNYNKYTDIDNVNSIIAERMRDRWIHFNEIKTIEEFNNAINYCFIHNCVFNREHIRPIFSVFTTAYNSYHKIERAYKSLINQTFKDWEFVVIDDSPDDNHFNFLRKLFSNDSRVRLFRKSENNGNIDNVFLI